ncbi:zinc ribbon domain-containing protein [Ignicoccus hospitalis]|uniref:Putative zinc-ribbon domain-containing protein n=1 Tax=Ignicoccus hospitalis (strain KIN4/I / DSM 18386 / JCM 14125) TaxID=453591 RepID=A8AA72_IGNH4|nr:zinc ribbon domain-containing protein [Ignicoccus hospitalis]ABU81824.1 hypothetical protein Igni_0642 [Ignicoccus hospitalis KIN4/I]HIH90093.1 hypothetical protein [Desulfurococcaceae archaeon]
MSNDRLKAFVEKVGSFKDVSYVAVSSEGLPYMIKGTERENAEYVAAVASSLYDRINELTMALNLGKEERSKIYYPEDYHMLLFKKDNFVVAIKYDFAIDKLIEALTNNLLKGIEVRCPYCKNDLSFDVVKCPKCGERLPFTEPKCWNCGADLTLKECPHCGNLIYYNGQKPSFIKLLIYKLKRIFGG